MNCYEIKTISLSKVRVSVVVCSDCFVGACSIIAKRIIILDVEVVKLSHVSISIGLERLSAKSGKAVFNSPRTRFT